MFFCKWFRLSEHNGFDHGIYDEYRRMSNAEQEMFIITDDLVSPSLLRFVFFHIVFLYCVVPGSDYCEIGVV